MPDSFGDTWQNMDRQEIYHEKGKAYLSNCRMIGLRSAKRLLITVKGKL